MAYEAAEKIKKLVEEWGFSPEQFNVVLEAMLASKKYHSRAQVQDLWKYSKPDYFDITSETKQSKFNENKTYKVFKAVAKVAA